MEVYAQVKRIPGKKTEVIQLSQPPQDWDDEEDKELQLLARQASLSAWNSISQIDQAKADECRKKILDEIKASL